jgi:hypothetical protein
MQKLLLGAFSIVVFTFSGADPVQVAAVIAFTAGVYATRLLENRDRAASASAPFGRAALLPSKKPFQPTEIPCAAEHHSI